MGTRAEIELPDGMKGLYRSTYHSVMKMGNGIRTAWEKLSPKALRDSIRSIIYKTIAHYYKIFIQYLMRYPAHNLTWGWYLSYSHSLMFLSRHFKSFITSDYLFLCICLNSLILSFLCLSFTLKVTPAWKRTFF